MKQLRAAMKGWDREAGVALVYAALAMVAFAYQGHPDFFYENFGGYAWVAARPDFACEAYRFGFSFVFFFLVPAILVRAVFRKSLADYGLALGDWKFGLAFVALSAIVLPLPVYLSAGSPDFLEAYPLWRGAGAGMASFTLWTFLYLFYYVGWEFFFRGFMQFSLVGRMAPFLIIMMQTLPSTIIHIGKPEGETAAAIVGGIVFGAVALRTKSILYPLIVHWYLGALTELFTILRSGAS